MHGYNQYIKVADWYKMELFKDIETYANMIIHASKTIYDGVVCDSCTEKKFAEDLDNMENVRLFIKLPGWFVVETPIGPYNPDWAVVMDDTDQFGEERETLYFVTETKGTDNIENLRPSEKRKIRCAKNHFKSIATEYQVVTSAKELRKRVKS